MKKIYTICDMNIFGNGVIKDQNKPIFVLKGATKDKVTIEIINEKKDYSFAKITSILEKGPNRMTPYCEKSNLCGGCPFAHVNLKEEIRVKQNYLEKLFNPSILKPPIIEENLHYRNKATFHIKNNKIGYYQPESNTLVAIDKCLLCNHKINEILGYLKNQSLPDGKITIRVSETTNECMVISAIPLKNR